MTASLAPLRWWHIPAVHDLEQQLFPSDCWSVEQFWQEIAQPTRHYVVALVGDQVVGYAGAFVNPPDADVQTVAVARDQQGSGIGRLLVQELLSEMSHRGARHAFLEVRRDNAAAIGLYERLGFTRMSERLRYYPDGGDAVIMQRTIEGTA